MTVRAIKLEAHRRLEAFCVRTFFLHYNEGVPWWRKKIFPYVSKLEFMLRPSRKKRT